MLANGRWPSGLHITPAERLLIEGNLARQERLELVEAPQGTRLVLMSEELMDKLAEPREGYTVTWEWGEPDEHGWYTPTFTEHPRG